MQAFFKFFLVPAARVDYDCEPGGNTAVGLRPTVLPG
jgi:hypothetical protein